jgi:hypothetical protein
MTFYLVLLSCVLSLDRSLKQKSEFSEIFCEIPLHEVRHSLVVRIPGSHPGGPGSIPGVGILFILLLTSI